MKKFKFMDLSYEITDSNNVKLIGPFDYSINSTLNIPQNVYDNDIYYNNHKKMICKNY